MLGTSELLLLLLLLAVLVWRVLEAAYEAVALPHQSLDGQSLL
jgi:hypothetical protein